MEFHDRVAEFCREKVLLLPGDRVICALSGGADSVALLWSLYLLREKWNLTISAAHFNHNLRGEESRRDENFVRKLCRRLEIPLTVGQGEIVRQGRGMEDAARRARYAFFATLDPTAKIATAHTADDNAETVLLHLLRGTGLRGLGGIHPQQGRIIRPMLTVTRREVEDFLNLWNLRHVEDSSNHGSDFLRNRIRRQVMPVLRQENPRFSRNCGNMAMGLRQDEDFLHRHATQALSALRRDGGIDCRGLLDLHPALQSRVVAIYLKELGVREPEQIHLRQVLTLAVADNPSAWVRFPGGVSLSRYYDLICPAVQTDGLETAILSVPGETRVGNWVITAKTETFRQKPAQTGYLFALNPQKLPPQSLSARARQPGDTVALPGGHRPVKKAMIDRKIPAALRKELPVIVAGEQVLAVTGVGVNLDFAAQVGEEALIIRVCRKEDMDTAPEQETETICPGVYDTR